MSKKIKISKLILFVLISIVLVVAFVHYTEYPIYVRAEKTDGTFCYFVNEIAYVVLPKEAVWEFGEYNFKKIGYLGNIFAPLYEEEYNEENYYYQVKDLIFNAPKVDIIKSNFIVPEYNAENIHELCFYIDYYSGALSRTRNRDAIEQFYTLINEDKDEKTNFDTSEINANYICCYNDDMPGAEVIYKVYRINDKFHLENGTTIPSGFIQQFGIGDLR